MPHENWLRASADIFRRAVAIVWLTALTISLLACDNPAPTPLPQPTATRVAVLPLPATQSPLATATSAPTLPAPTPSPFPTSNPAHYADLSPRSARHSGRLFMVSKDDGWYTSGNSLFRWNGQQWIGVGRTSLEPSSAVTDFKALGYLDAEHIWLAGIFKDTPDGKISEGYVLSSLNGPHINIWAASKEDSFGGGFNAISALADNDIWVAGYKYTDAHGTIAPLIMHWNGDGLAASMLPFGSYTLNAIAMLNQHEGWAVGSGGMILYYKDSQWQTFASPTTDPLLAIDMLSATDGWAVGRYANIIHWNGSRWDKVPGPWPPYTELVGISMISPDDGWLIGYVNGDNRSGVGSNGTSLPRIMHWDGKQWLDVDATGVNPYFDSISMVSHDEGWILVPALHWDGSEWNNKGVALQTPNPGNPLP